MFCKKESHLIPTFVAKYMNNDKRIARNGSLLTVLKFFMHLILQLSNRYLIKKWLNKDR